jgi:two-component system response regulator RegX3
MKKRIMVLDDDEQIRQSLQKFLQAEGYEVVLAAEGVQALDEFRRTGIDLLLLDLNLPNKSGWDIFEQLTSSDPLFPIIIITGRAKQSELAAAAGVGALMEKPLDIPLLLKTITALLLEPPEDRLKRLVGIEKSTPCFHTASPVSTVPKSFKRARKEPKTTHHL